MGDPPAAHRVAHDLARRIVENGWAIGYRLGTEPALMAELGVGRATFREGVRILERQGVVRAGAGARGGLTVQAPATAAFSNVIRNHIELSEVSFGELVLAHRILSHVSADLALARVTPARINDLRAALILPGARRLSRDQEGMAVTEFETAMLRLSDNPALSHFISTLTRLMADFSHQERSPREVWRNTLQEIHVLNEQILERLAVRDARVHEAIDQRSDYVIAMQARLEQLNGKIWSGVSFLNGSYSSALIGRERDQKAALKLSYELAAMIRRGSLPPGARLGTEQEIATRHGVSRTMVVEALRMLEFLGIVRILRGRTAGVEVITPDPTLVVQSAALYLEYIDPLPGDLQILRRGLEWGAIAAISDKISDAAVSPLALEAQRFLDVPKEGQRDAAAQLYRRLMELTKNRVIILLGDILAIVHRKHRQEAPAQNPELVCEAGHKLSAALAAPDGAPVAGAIIDLILVLDQMCNAESDGIAM